MFKKTERLTQKEFSKFFKSGKKYNFPHLTIITDSNNSLKIGVVVGKKVSKSAVKRNLLKRRIYSVLQKEIKKSDFKGVFIILTKPTYSSLPRRVAEEFVKESIAQVLKNT